jgi:hypothetical protein
LWTNLAATNENNREEIMYSQGAINTGAIVCKWFDKYSHEIPRQGREAVAFLSRLFSERRADRVYDPKEKRLEDIVRIAMGIRRTLSRELRSWRDADGLSSEVPNLTQMRQNLTSC